MREMTMVLCAIMLMLSLGDLQVSIRKGHEAIAANCAARSAILTLPGR